MFGFVVFVSLNEQRARFCGKERQAAHCCPKQALVDGAPGARDGRSPCAGFLRLGFCASKKLFLGAGLVGVGLVCAGVSDNCMMASLLGRMPWNDPKNHP